MAGDVLLERRVRGRRSIAVFESGGERHLVFEGANAVQTVVRVGAPGYPILAYARALAAAVGFLPPPRRALILGLGGGNVPMLLRRSFPGASIDVLEIDRDVAELARAWFEYEEDARLRTHLVDGRAFLEGTRRRWDLIFLDAYAEAEVPAHLATREFLALVRSRLAPGGAALSNVWGAATNRRYRSMLRTHQEIFDGLWVLRATRSGNRILIGLPDRRGLTKPAAVEAARRFGAARGFRFDPGTIVAAGLEEVVAPVAAPPLVDEEAAPSRPRAGKPRR